MDNRIDTAVGPFWMVSWSSGNWLDHSAPYDQYPKVGLS
jgi:hypothetical protein